MPVPPAAPAPNAFAGVAASLMKAKKWAGTAKAAVASAAATPPPPSTTSPSRAFSRRTPYASEFALSETATRTAGGLKGPRAAAARPGTSSGVCLCACACACRCTFCLYRLCSWDAICGGLLNGRGYAPPPFVCPPHRPLQ